jgi:hypothetical protein
MRFRKGRSTVIARTGDEVVVEPGSYHRFANASTQPAVVRVQVQPALSMERLYQTVVGLARDGRTTPTGMPKPLELALFLREFARRCRRRLRLGWCGWPPHPWRGWPPDAGCNAATPALGGDATWAGAPRRRQGRRHWPHPDPPGRAQGHPGATRRPRRPRRGT